MPQQRIQRRMETKGAGKSAIYRVSRGPRSIGASGKIPPLKRPLRDAGNWVGLGSPTGATDTRALFFFE